MQRQCEATTNKSQCGSITRRVGTTKKVRKYLIFESTTTQHRCEANQYRSEGDDFMMIAQKPDERNVKLLIIKNSVNNREICFYTIR